MPMESRQPTESEYRTYTVTVRLSDPLRVTSWDIGKGIEAVPGVNSVVAMARHTRIVEDSYGGGNDD